VNAWNSYTEIKIVTAAISIPVGQTIWLQGPNGQYVSSKNGVGPMWCNATAVAGWNGFLVVDAGGGKVALQNQTKYVSSENGAQSMTCSRDTFEDWEKFDWISNTDGTVSLRGNNGLYVSSENATIAMTCNRPEIGGWESFHWGVVGAAAAAAVSAMETSSISGAANGVRAYPNPVIDKLSYEIPAGSGAYSVEVKKADGTTVHASKGQGGGTQTLDASAWSRGTYYVTVTRGEQKTTFRIVKP